MYDDAASAAADAVHTAGVGIGAAVLTQIMCTGMSELMHVRMQM